jgi:Fe-S cluster biogenesis protein NfuA
MNTLNSRIEAALDHIRPFLEADHGGVTLVEVTAGNVARVEFHGACRDCSMSFMTLKAGVEQSILKAVPEIIAVEAVNVVNQA